MHTVKRYVFADIFLKHFLIQREKDKWNVIMDSENTIERC